MATEWEQISTGLQTRKLDTGFTHVRIHYSTDPLKDELWARRLSAKYGGMETPKWRREFEIDYSAVRGQPVYPMLSRVHVVSNSIVERTLFRVVDHGIRHPMVCLWIAVARNGDRHVYREYFRSGTTIEVNCQEVLRRTPDDEYVYATYIDPSTRQRIPLSNKDKQLVSHLSLYNNAFGSSCLLADNSRAGYDAVRDGLLSKLARDAMQTGQIDEDGYFAREYFKEFDLSNEQLLTMASKPMLTFEPCCPRTFQEMRNLRFKEISGDVTAKAAPEEVIDYEDDGPDCVRYGMQSKMFWRPGHNRPQKGSALYEIAQKRSAINPRRVKR